jgi:hypothetical protein
MKKPTLKIASRLSGPSGTIARSRKTGTRHEFSSVTRKTLAERSGYRCSNPECGAATVGPSLVDPEASARVGMAAHIRAASPKGPRYSKQQTKAQRTSADNGLWMCETCGKLVDSDESGHTVTELREWKQSAERKARAELGLASRGVLFNLRHGDQTTYINLPRVDEMAIAKGFQLAGLPKFNRPLLDTEGRLGSIVMVLERVLQEMKPEAVPMDQIKTKAHCDAVVGRLISFKGRFRSRNAPRVKAGGVPEYHPTGNPEKDHVIHKQFGAIELVLPLDSFWYASQSSVGFYRGMGYVAVRGLARVHSIANGRIIASPFWMALPGEPLFD